MHKPFVLFALLFGFGCIPQSGISQTFVEIFKAASPDPDLTGVDEHGSVVAIRGEWAIVGSANGYDENGSNFISRAGSAYLYFRNLKGQWDFYQKIVAPIRELYDLFGVSAVSICNEFAIVGSRREDENPWDLDSLTNAGAAYIYSLDSLGTWVIRQKFIASDRKAEEEFGATVAAGNGVMMVGTPQAEIVGMSGAPFSAAGAVYVFQPDSLGEWEETQKLVLANPKGGDRFGSSLAISGDFAAIGAPEEDHQAGGNFLTDAGAVYIYQRDTSGQWNLFQQLTPADREAFDWFGHSVDITDSLLIVGAIWEEDDLAGQTPMAGAGAAYIFRLQPSGMWEEEQKMIAPNRGPLEHFGQSVTIEKGYAAISETINNQGQFGDTYLYKQDSTGNWGFWQALVSSDSSFTGFGFYGKSIDMDEGSILIGAPRISQGKIYLFAACEADATYLQDSSCLGSPYLFGEQWLSTAGQYFDTLQSATGCDSAVVLNLSVQEVETQLVESDTALFATAVAADFQWLDCANGYQPISGATEAQFLPAGSGTYAVAVSQYGCTDTSACVAFITASQQPSWASSLLLFPNPGSQEVHLQFGVPQPEFHLQLLNMTGQTLFQRTYRQTDRLTLPLPPTAGLYLLQIRDQQGAILLRKIETY